MAIECRVYVAMALVAFVATACGGEDSVRPTPQAQPSMDASADPCAADDGFDIQPLSTFETAIMVGTQTWYSSHDKTADVTNLLCTTSTYSGCSGRDAPRGRLETPRCGESEYALHLYATGVKLWGAALAIELNVLTDGGSTSLDASTYDGLSFWARRSAEWTDDAGIEHRSGRSLFAAAADKYTHQNGMHCVWDHVRDAEKCDRFGLGVGLDTEWRFYAIRFDEMRQRGFGKPSPSGQLDRVLFDINFGVEAGDWDIWLDDVGLFRAPRADR